MATCNYQVHTYNVAISSGANIIRTLYTNIIVIINTGLDIKFCSYIDVLFTLRSVSVHEADYELPSHGNSCTIPLDIATSDHTPPVGSNDRHSCSHYEILLTSYEFSITGCNGCC